MSFYPRNAREVRTESEQQGTLDGNEVHMVTTRPPSGTEQMSVFVIERGDRVRALDTIGNGTPDWPEPSEEYRRVVWS